MPSVSLVGRGVSVMVGVAVAVRVGVSVIVILGVTVKVWVAVRVAVPVAVAEAMVGKGTCPESPLVARGEGVRTSAVSVGSSAIVGKTATGVPAPAQAASAQTINKEIRGMIRIMLIIGAGTVSSLWL
jgi:hypothetical protein